MSLIVDRAMKLFLGLPWLRTARRQARRHAWRPVPASGFRAAYQALRSQAGTAGSDACRRV